MEPPRRGQVQDLIVLRSAHRGVMRIAVSKLTDGLEGMGMSDTDLPFSSDAPRIGAQLRAARQRQGLSLTETALRSEMTKGYLSEVERDRSTASVATLLRLCRVLNVSLASLFTASSNRLVRLAERAPVVFGGAGVEDYRLTPASESRLTVVQSILTPGGGSGDEPYSLTSGVEFVLVLEGVLDIRFDDESHRLAAGDSFTFDELGQRSWRNPSAISVTRLMWAFSEVKP
jgi:transcriptional regulator with XRE-family HTH domain